MSVSTRLWAAGLAIAAALAVSPAVQAGTGTSDEDARSFPQSAQSESTDTEASAAAENGSQPPASSIPQSDLSELSCSVLVQTFNILMDNAIEAPSPAKAASCCREAIKQYAADNGHAENIFEGGSPAAEDADRTDALRRICADYRTAVKKIPELAQDPKFTAAAAQGIMDSADDVYTVFVGSDEYADFDSSISGDFSGSLGAMLLPSRDSSGRPHFVVAELAPDSPAARSGLKPGDELTSIDGKKLSSATPGQCVQWMRGPSGSTAVLTYIPKVMRLCGRSDERKISMQRGEVHYPAVTAKIVNADGQEVSGKDGAKAAGACLIGIMRVDTFGLSVNIEAERALRGFEEAGCSGYILDLRRNPGGYTNAARDLCSKLLPQDSLIASLVDKDGHTESEIRTYRNMHVQKPLAVLIDGQTASAAEITAGALQAHKAAFLIGTPSFGKNSSQKIYNIEFPPGQTSACKVTYSHYKTPDGRDLGRTGLTPDLSLEMAPNLRRSLKTDVQLKKALEVVKNQISKAGQEPSRTK